MKKYIKRKYFNDPVAKAIVANLLFYRGRYKISQDRLSKLADIPCQTISKIEAYATRYPTQTTLEKIAKALRIKVEDLINQELS